MKIMKTVFGILCLSLLFVACEADSVNDEVGVNETIDEETLEVKMKDSYDSEDEDYDIPPE